MSVVEIRSKVHQIIDRLDEGFLNVVHSMLDTYIQQQKADPVIGYDIDGTPKHSTVMETEMRLQVDAAKRGEFTTLENLRKESDEWLAAIK